MTRFIKVSVFALLFAYAGVCQAGAFATCEDAKTYGKNKASYFVNVTYNRLDCNSAELPKTQDALTNVFKKGVLRTTDADDVKTCYYDGMVDGYLEMLLKEYDECSGEAGFETLPVVSVGRTLGSIFAAAGKTVKDHFLTDDGVTAADVVSYDLSDAGEVTDQIYQDCFYAVYYQIIEDLDLEEGDADYEKWLNVVVAVSDQVCFYNYYDDTDSGGGEG